MKQAVRFLEYMLYVEKFMTGFLLKLLSRMAFPIILLEHKTIARAPSIRFKVEIAVFYFNRMNGILVWKATSNVSTRTYKSQTYRSDPSAGTKKHVLLC